jgi:hypothetical protein
VDRKEAAAFLGTTTEAIKELIQKGALLPVSQKRLKLGAMEVDGEWEIEDEQFDAFQKAFNDEEPGRHPPAWVIRSLSVEARHRCGICEQPLPLQFHHIIEWSKLKHYEPAWMIAVCGGCHDKIRRGEIDRKSQEQYKEKLRLRSADVVALDAQFQSLIATSAALPILKELLRDMQRVIADGADAASIGSDYTFVRIEEKNEINRVSVEYFDEYVLEDEVHVAAFDKLIKDPQNHAIKESYYCVAADLRERLLSLSANGIGFEFAFIKLRDHIATIVGNMNSMELRMLKALIAFMYVNCDIGRKA